MVVGHCRRCVSWSRSVLNHHSLHRKRLHGRSGPRLYTEEPLQADLSAQPAADIRQFPNNRRDQFGRPAAGQRKSKA